MHSQREQVPPFGDWEPLQSLGGWLQGSGDPRDPHISVKDVFHGLVVLANLEISIDVECLLICWAGRQGRGARLGDDALGDAAVGVVVGIFRTHVDRWPDRAPACN